MSTDDKRPYRSALREEHAAATRARVLDAAAECFTETGYQGTSLAAIARRAGVSVDTVQATGAKRDLLLGAFERTFVGVETRDITRGDTHVARLIGIEDPREMLAAMNAETVAATGRVRALWWAFRGAAASDEGVQEILHGLLERRHRDFRAFVDVLRGKGVVIPDGERVAVEAELALAPETYAHFVDDHGWTQERYRDWAVERVAALVFAPGS
ncbi:helix-turn-helix domain-containing protein [Galbitalea sp. SE-J8]|uniref:TetR/AcrR family transcriptional regulator n=1 Tax=Galbitalea sp. SE-J8 TaxID=3054952 RepID=UPI00259C9118|nr:TetR/AcrR family transcriptional regulator [Galbitalea sp. SE-J8]MDM4762852.1 helix-turn-helix domain-containing protein [Galbitalea sp. SE-J8]